MTTLTIEKDLVSEIDEEYYEAYSEAMDKWEEECMLAQEAIIEAQIELMEEPEYKKWADSLKRPLTYFKAKREILTKKTLMFGLNKNPRGTVSPSEWELFREKHITPLFPGFTEIEVKGYWEGQPENSIELIIACSDNFSNEHKINEIMKAYNQKFNQDCVMKTSADNTVEFYEKR